MNKTLQTIAESIRVACLDAARSAYDDAGVRGLCAEGRWERAMDAIRDIDLNPLIQPESENTN